MSEDRGLCLQALSAAETLRTNFLQWFSGAEFAGAGARRQINQKAKTINVWVDRTTWLSETPPLWENDSLKMQREDCNEKGWFDLYSSIRADSFYQQSGVKIDLPVMAKIKLY